MADFNLRADAVDVEQIMRQIRARIREKRGVDYTEEQIQELARVRLEKFLDPQGLRSDLLERFQQTAQQDVPLTYEFDDKTLIRSSNPLVALFRRLLQPVLKLFFSPNPLVHALHTQTQINSYLLERAQRDVLVYEVMHNLVVEMTRTGIEVKNMQMRVESVASRLDFNERRARALEAVVQYRPDASADRFARSGEPARQGDRQEPARQGEPRGDQPRPGWRGEGTGDGAAAVDPITGGESLRSRRRRRRRGRRTGTGFPTEERRVTIDELERGTSGGDLERAANSSTFEEAPDSHESGDAQERPEQAAPDRSDAPTTTAAPVESESDAPQAGRPGSQDPE